MYCYDSYAMISGNVISGNTATNGGGGVWCTVDDESTLINNSISKNTVLAGGIDGGGGIGMYESFPSINNNILSYNMADKGAAIDCNNNSSVTFANNTVFGNSAAIKGAGIHCRKNSAMTISNSILWGNDAPDGKEIWIGISTAPSTVTISYSDVEGGQALVYIGPNCSLNWGSGMIDTAPQFADPSNGDFHLTWDSPCKDTGDNTSVTELYDFENDPRIWDGTVDMGADEFHTHLYHMGNVFPGGKIQVKVVGDPGVTPVTLALGSGVQDPPQSTPYGDLYLILPPVKTWNLVSIPSNGVRVVPATVPPPVKTWNLVSIPSNGVRVVPATVPTSWQQGDEYQFQALLGPLAPGSVLSNLMTLKVE
jgi:parallel beta-helix repeat protein